MAERKQSGAAHDYTEWVVEAEEGVTPADPDWNPMSDNVRTVFDGEPDAGTDAQRGLGGRDPVGFFNGPEQHEYTFTYDLQQWYVDASGNVLDPAGACMVDTADNDIIHTHTVVSREVHVDGGADGGGRYIYTVGKGGRAATLTIPFETDDGLPIQQELTYRFEKVREYSVSQPAAAIELVARSTDPADTTQTLTVESDDGTTSETIALDGTTDVVTTATFDSIESAALDAETQGDVELGTSDGAATPSIQTLLLTIPGVASNQNIEGDLGIPVTGAGSHATAIGSPYIRFNEDQLAYTGPEPIAPEIISGEANVDNGVDGTGKDQSVRQSIDVGQRETTVSASLAGPKPSVDQMVTYLQEVPNDIVWTSTQGGTLTFPNARLTSTGSIARETDAAKLVAESEWASEGIVPAA